jgi:hypothetical protein
MKAAKAIKDAIVSNWWRSRRFYWRVIGVSSNSIGLTAAVLTLVMYGIARLISK